MGTAGGLLGQLGAKVVSRVLNPQTADAAKRIIESGVTPTPGQIMGGTWAKLETAAQKIPFLGQGIRDAKTAAIHEFNGSVINKALAPIGASVNEIGHEGVLAARQAVEKAYDTAIDMVPIVDFGPKQAGKALALPGEAVGNGPSSFWVSIERIKEMGKTLKPEYSKQLDSLIQKNLVDKLTPAGTMSGEATSYVKNEFAREARNFRKGNPGRDDLQIADALDAVKESIMGKIGEADPVAADIIKKANASHAMLLRVEHAAKDSSAPEGIFSPAAFSRAVKAQDLSLRKKNVSFGKALMQDESKDARLVLGDNLPKSDFGDTLAGLSTLGALATGAVAPAFGAPLLSAVPLAVGATARAAYTRPGQKAIAAALTSRPDFLRQTGTAIGKAAPLTGLLGMGVADAQ